MQMRPAKEMVWIETAATALARTLGEDSELCGIYDAL
jgi:hypothetical protein